MNRKLSKESLAIIVLAGVALASDAYPCSAFQWTLRDPSSGGSARPLVAKSYDWIAGFDHGYVFENKRNVSKTALNLNGMGEPAQWVSKFASLTFNQFGRDLPKGGMNEKGLIVEILQLALTNHIPSSDPRPFVNESQWIQYQLDQFSTTREVVANLCNIRVDQAYLGVHYFVCDKSGDCAVIEYLDGKAVIHTGSRDLPIPAITNSTYLESYHFYIKNKFNTVPGSSSLARFLRVAQSVSRTEATARQDAFDLLAQVEQDEARVKSIWNIVYDPERGLIEFKTRSAPKSRILKMSRVNPSCKTPVTVWNMNLEGSEHSSGESYSPSLNRVIADQNKLPGITSTMLEKAAVYPETSTYCTE